MEWVLVPHVSGIADVGEGVVSALILVDGMLILAAGLDVGDVSDPAQNGNHGNQCPHGGLLQSSVADGFTDPRREQRYADRAQGIRDYRQGNSQKTAWPCARIAKGEQNGGEAKGNLGKAEIRHEDRME